MNTTNLSQHEVETRETGLKLFYHSYLEALIWTEEINEPEMAKNIFELLEQMAPETREKIHSECDAFFNENYDMIKADYLRAGHDFWLTRNGHGAGFWDGDWLEHGDTLTTASKKFGEVHVYVGDDEKVYACEG